MSRPPKFEVEGIIEVEKAGYKVEIKSELGEKEHWR